MTKLANSNSLGVKYDFPNPGVLGDLFTPFAWIGWGEQKLPPSVPESTGTNYFKYAYRKKGSMPLACDCRPASSFLGAIVFDIQLQAKVTFTSSTIWAVDRAASLCGDGRPHFAPVSEDRSQKGVPVRHFIGNYGPGKLVQDI